MSKPPALAKTVFGHRLPLAERYAEFLATAGIERGLLGPREVPRIWDRHLLNCAPLTELLPEGARVVDVGSGAGLPGIVIAIRRPDLRVDLLESLQRRVDFLAEAVGLLGLSEQVRVIRGRAEERAAIDQVGGAPFVTARAVAPLDRLVRWCLPLLSPGGKLVALKGASAEQELAQYRTAVRRLGGADAKVVLAGSEPAERVRVIVITRGTGERGRT